MAIIVCNLARKMVQIFFGPVCFRGHFEEIGIAKVLLGTKPRRVEKFRRCRFSDVCESVLRKKETSVKYNNGLHAIATLDRATLNVKKFIYVFNQLSLPLSSNQHRTVAVQRYISAVDDANRPTHCVTYVLLVEACC